MMTHADIISAWPRIAEFASDIGVSASHARVMKLRNSIPVSYWDSVLEGARNREIDCVSLRLLLDGSRTRHPPSGDESRTEGGSAVVADATTI